MREAITQEEYDDRIEHMQGARRCATCAWYIKINEEQRARYAPCSGWCHLTLPFRADVHRSFQGIDDPNKTWCSLWEPDLVAIANGA